MDLGNWFHYFGVEYLKDRAAKVLYLTSGLCKMIPLLLKHMWSFLFCFVLMRSCMYFGAVLLMHLKVVVRILYLIFCCIGNQHNFFNADDELEYLFLFKTSLAHMLWIVRFSWCGVDFGSL